MDDKTYRKGSSTAERVATEIRRAIRHRDLLPGEHVRQEYWAQQLGVSSGPTREALKMLVAEQLLSYDAHRGYFVTRIDEHEMKQVYLLRRLLETEVLRSIRWPDEDKIAEIRGLMDAVLECVKQNDGHGALEASRMFCFTVFDLSPLEMIVRETRRLWELAVVYRALSLGIIEDPTATSLAIYYDSFIECLRRQDHDGLIELNSAQRSNIPRILADV